MARTRLLAAKRWYCIICIMISFFLVSSAIAQNKVVVIPLTETVEAPLDPFAPVAAVSPPDSAYTIANFGVIDNVTGLMWEKTASMYLRSWEDAWDYCQNKQTGFGGALDDWRLPCVAELMSIVDYGTYNPAINGTAFPGTSSQPYWSATPDADRSGEAWFLSFYRGDGGSTDKYLAYYVRCVRKLSARDSTFRNNGNGTVTDLATGLTWQRQDDNILRGWTLGVSYCQWLSLAGGSWRLPNIKELRSIIDDRVSDPAIDEGVFVGTDVSHYWSATASASYGGYAWSVNFNGGYVNHLSNPSPGYVRCVR